MTQGRSGRFRIGLDGLSFRALGKALLVVVLVTMLLAQPALASGEEEKKKGGEGILHEEDTAFYHFTELLQFVGALAAMAGVVLAGQKYGGKVGRALYISGAGVGIFALQRLWHNLAEYGVLGTKTPYVLKQFIFGIVVTLLAVGFIMLWNTMRSHT